MIISAQADGNIDGAGVRASSPNGHILTVILAEEHARRLASIKLESGEHRAINKRVDI